MLLAACGSSGAASPAATNSATQAAAAGSGVTYTVAQYKLPALTVAPGTKVTVVDGDDEPHTVTADGGAFDTGSFDKTNPGSFTAPSKPGSYAIHCKVHPSMHGTIIVR